jgi:hypothetical protein
MTRFKELERIEAALESGVHAELEWALRYCEARIAVSPSSRHEKAWQQRRAKVRSRLGARAASSTRADIPER